MGAVCPCMACLDLIERKGVGLCSLDSVKHSLLFSGSWFHSLLIAPNTRPNWQQFRAQEMGSPNSSAYAGRVRSTTLASSIYPPGEDSIIIMNMWGLLSFKSRWNSFAKNKFWNFQSNFLNDFSYLNKNLNIELYKKVHIPASKKIILVKHESI